MIPGIEKGELNIMEKKIGITAGKWTINTLDSNDKTTYGIRLHRNDGKCFAEIHKITTFDCMLADAKAIAAVPELIEAIEEVINESRYGYVKSTGTDRVQSFEIPKATFHNLIQALKKAIG